MMWNLVILATFCCFMPCQSENATFTPTKTWQEIREGQTIPAGLHVRMNLQTGKKEARLLGENENEKDNEALERTKETQAGKHLQISDGTDQYSAEKIEQIKRKYKSYNEIKKSFEEMKANFKTDAEIITQILDEYRNITKEDNPAVPVKSADFIRIMENLNYLVHQIDNALWFIDAGGLDAVILPMIVNQTNVALRAQSLRVLGALSQNNPKAQIKVFEKNFGSHITQILISSTNTEELSTAIYAFGSLLRKFPHAQREILSKSGTQALVTVIRKDCELSIKAKAVTLISDLIIEKELSLSKELVASDGASAIEQYKEVLLTEWLKANDYCESTDAALSDKLYDLIQDTAVTEYFIHALHICLKTCYDRWSQSPQLRHTLLTLRNRLNQTGEEYQLEVAQNIEKLTELLYADSHKRDEL